MPFTIQAQTLQSQTGFINREFHTTNYSSFDNKFYIFGGTDVSENDTNDLFSLELLGEKVEFQKIDCEHSPEKRSDHCSVIYNNRVYIFGGFGEKVSDTLWQYDISQQIFKKLETKNNQMKPSERHGQKATLYQNKMIIFGGEVFGSGNLTHDLYELNLDTLEWRKIFFEGYVDFEKEDDDAWDNLDPDLAPCPREGFAMEIYQNFLVIFGGLDSNSNSLNDLWLFPLDTKGAKWTLIEQQDEDSEVWPSERCFHSLIKISDHLLLSVFGKQIQDVSEHLSDLSDDEDEEDEENEKREKSKAKAIDTSSDDDSSDDEPASPSVADIPRKHSSNTSPIAKLSFQIAFNRERLKTNSASSSTHGSPTQTNKNGINGSPALSPRAALARKMSVKSFSGFQDVTSPVEDVNSQWDEDFGKNIPIEEAFYVFNFESMKWEKAVITNLNEVNLETRIGFSANYDTSSNRVLIYGGFGKRNVSSSNSIAICLQLQ